jgi:hypothetical protein
MFHAVRRWSQLVVVVALTLGGIGAASAQQGTGSPCTSGWPTNYTCEEFYWNGTTSSQALWTTSQGYCYLNSANLGADGQSYMKVVAVNGRWQLQGGPTQSTLRHWGSAMCVTYPWYKSYLQGSYTGNSSVANWTKLTTNKNFCSLAGVQYKPDASHATSFASAAYEYPSYAHSVDLHASVQNAGSSADISYGQCLVAPDSYWLYWAGGYWWGTGKYSDRTLNPAVYVYSTGPGYLYTDAPAYDTNCMITQIYPVPGKAFWVDVNVEDESGNWYVYADQGVKSVQVACIMNSH